MKVGLYVINNYLLLHIKEMLKSGLIDHSED